MIFQTPLVELEKMNARYQAKKSTCTRIGLEPVELSPFHHVASNSPPAIIYHGTKDKTCLMICEVICVAAKKKWCFCRS